MDRLRARLARSGPQDGMSLVEVVVAMVIFALVSAGLVYGMLSVMSVTRDARARETATNLAAEEIDLSRAVANVFDLLDTSRTVTLNGDVFDVERKTQWVSDPDADFSCGGSGAGNALRYKKVNVAVTWGSMRGTATPVTTSTVINPSEHINDPTKGTILVSVLNAAGTGAAGVSIGASPSVGSVISPTDAQGCTYVLKVPVGSYTVTATKAGYISDQQLTAPSQTVVVTAGGSSSIGFQMDVAGTFRTKLAPAGPGSPKYPTNPKVSFTNTYGTFAMSPTSGAGGQTPSFALHPFPAGYRVFAGECLAADPLQWPEVPSGSGTLRGLETEPVAALPGGSVDTDVPLGVVQVAGHSTDRFLKVVSTNVAGLPGCVATVTYTYGSVLPSSATSWVNIALPYGTWKFYRGSSATSITTALTSASVKVASPKTPERSSVAADGTTTLDPRVVVTL